MIKSDNPRHVRHERLPNRYINEEEDDDEAFECADYLNVDVDDDQVIKLENNGMNVQPVKQGKLLICNIRLRREASRPYTVQRNLFWG